MCQSRALYIKEEHWYLDAGRDGDKPLRGGQEGVLMCIYSMSSTIG